MNITKLLYAHSLNQPMLAEILGIPNEYVSMYNTGNKLLPPAVWQKIHDYIMTLDKPRYCKSCETWKKETEFHWHTVNVRRHHVCKLCRNDMRTCQRKLPGEKVMNNWVKVKWK